MSKIKNCPFCGSPATLESSEHPSFVVVVCDNCRASGPERRRENSASAIELWNKRVEGAGK